MAEKNCFCHLTSSATGETYTVKDKVARDLIGELLGRTRNVEGEIQKDKEALVKAREELEKAIELAEESVDIANLNSRINSVDSRINSVDSVSVKKFQKSSHTKTTAFVQPENTDNIIGVHVSSGIENGTLSNEKAVNAIVARDEEGFINVHTPEKPSHVVNKEYVDGFVPQVENTGSRDAVYVQKSNDNGGGVELRNLVSTLPNGTSTYKYTIVMRGSDGRFGVVDPENEFDVVNKRYVDNMLGGLNCIKVREHSAPNNFLVNVNTIYATSIEIHGFPIAIKVLSMPTNWYISHVGVLNGVFSNWVHTDNTVNWESTLVVELKTDIVNENGQPPTPDSIPSFEVYYLGL